jgi:hypothetical protein
MARYDVKYNPSAAYIPGATQVGTLAVAIGPVDYSTGGWYGGVDDSLGYVIYSDTSSTNLAGRPAGSASSTAQALKPTFFRSKGKTDAALLELINRLPGNTQSFNNINDARAWVNSSGNLGTFEVSSGSSGSSGTSGSSGSSGTSGSSGSSGTSGGGTSSYIITIKEVGSNIVMAGSGTLNINGLTLLAGATGPMNGAGLGVNSATFILGANGGYFDQYGGILTNPTNFGSGSGLGSDTSSGDIVGAVYNGAPPHLLIVPVGYTSGSYLSSSQTFNNKSFSSLGLTPGTYSYTWGTGSNAETMRVVVGGTASGGGGGATGSTGSGWLFYSGEGSLDANPPLNIGNAIFVINTSVETFDPNKVNGKALYFNRYDSNGVDYATQFASLQTNGGTLSITQNGNTVTYTTTNPNMFVFNSNPNGYLMVNTGMLTQTAAVINPFVYGDPITLSFS